MVIKKRPFYFASPSFNTMKKEKEFIVAEFTAIRLVSQNWQVCICLWDEETQDWQTTASMPYMAISNPGEKWVENPVSFQTLVKVAKNLAKMWPEYKVSIVAFPPIAGGQFQLLLIP